MLSNDARDPTLIVRGFASYSEMNFVKAAVAGPDKIECPLGIIAAAMPLGVTTGAAVTLAIRPEHVEVTPCQNGGAAAITGRVATRSYLGDSALLEVEVNGVTLLAKLAGDTALGVGQSAAVNCPGHRWHVFP